MRNFDFIRNMNNLYKPALSAEQQKFYNEFLSKFTENQLEELWQATMESHEYGTAPTIGRLKKYSKDVTPVKFVDHVKQSRENLTEEDVFSTRLGRLSLRQGWADNYLTTCRENGIPEQTDEVLLKFQQSQHDAEEAYKSLDDVTGKGGVLNQAYGLKRLRESMRERNREFCEQYKHLWKNNNLLTS